MLCPRRRASASTCAANVRERLCRQTHVHCELINVLGTRCLVHAEHREVVGAGHLNGKRSFQLVPRLETSQKGRGIVRRIDCLLPWEHGRCLADEMIHQVEVGRPRCAGKSRKEYPSCVSRLRLYVPIVPRRRSLKLGRPARPLNPVGIVLNFGLLAERRPLADASLRPPWRLRVSPPFVPVSGVIPQPCATRHQAALVLEGLAFGIDLRYENGRLRAAVVRSVRLRHPPWSEFAGSAAVGPLLLPFVPLLAR